MSLINGVFILGFVAGAAAPLCTIFRGMAPFEKIISNKM